MIVVTPGAPPSLNARAARALLTLLLDAMRDSDVDRVERQIASHASDE
jgi:hypothetical protein